MSVVRLQVGWAPHHRVARTRRRHRYGWLRRAGATVREWHRRSRDRAALARLDERTLQDIGLSRAEAQFIVNKPFWRE